MLYMSFIASLWILLIEHFVGCFFPYKFSILCNVKFDFLKLLTVVVYYLKVFILIQNSLLSYVFPQIIMSPTQ